jgi:MoaA/NifB/PqqE/SkfB family radical SAM enzyme
VAPLEAASAYRESTGLELTLELGNFCPLGCLHCSQDAGPFKTNSLPLKKALEIIGEAKSLGADTIAISGGEPLCSPHLISICEFSKSMALRVFVYTAGSLIEKNTLAPINNVLAENLARLGVDRIIVNLQAATNELHDTITGRHGSYDNAMKSMRKLISEGLRVEIHFVPMKLNIRELTGVADLAKKLGVAQVNVIRFVPQGRGSRNRRILEPQSDDYREFSSVLRLTIAESKLPIRISEAFSFLRMKSTYQCLAGRRKLVVSGDGAVCPCAAFKGFLAGNPAYSVNSRSLLDIWSTGIFEGLRNGTNSVPNCGCPAQRLLFEGKISRDHPSEATQTVDLSST